MKAAWQPADACRIWAAERTMPNYTRHAFMAKGSLEAACANLANHPRPEGTRVNAISAGPDPHSGGIRQVKLSQRCFRTMKSDA